MARTYRLLFFFFFNDTATTEIYTLSLHDALPISLTVAAPLRKEIRAATVREPSASAPEFRRPDSGSLSLCSPSSPAPSRSSGRRSEEHTSELQSRLHLVCRLLLEKKKTYNPRTAT